MSFAHRRQAISDHAWHLLDPPLPGRAGRWGGLANDNRPLIHAVFWVLRTGLPGAMCRRMMGLGVTHIVASQVGEIRGDGRACWTSSCDDWRMNDARPCKGHPQAAGAQDGHPRMRLTNGGATQSGIWLWMRLVCRSGRLVRIGRRIILGAMSKVL